MKLSHVPIGSPFRYKGQDYIKSNYNRGIYKDINNKRLLKQFSKSTEVEVDESQLKWA